LQDICRETGDNFVNVEYERFNELKVLDEPLNAAEDYKSNIRPGDCVVAFSRNDIFAIRKEIEANTPYKCCVVYGNLPPETRAQQAKLFNDPDSGYDILVASDAIGMGLNLNIRRVIFHTIYKSNGHEFVRLDHSSFKQIGGRAGRRNSQWKFGEVTCRKKEDMKHMKSYLSKEIPMMKQAGLLPSVEHIEEFAEVSGERCEPWMVLGAKSERTCDSYWAQCASMLTSFGCRFARRIIGPRRGNDRNRGRDQGEEAGDEDRRRQVLGPCQGGGYLLPLPPGEHERGG
jgi:superfamily II DNA/RNA helicase